MNAIISCSNKEKLEQFAEQLVQTDPSIKIYSSSGTYKALSSMNEHLVEIAAYTGFPEMPGGLVKTLNPKIHAGILADRQNKAHLAYLREHHIEQFDIVVANLYPFQETVSAGKDFETVRQHIDIGGVSLIEAAAKNMQHVLVVVDPADYDAVIEQLTNGITDEFRKKMAGKALRYLADYLENIARYFA